VISDTDTVRASTHPWAVKFRDNALIREARQYSSWPLFTLLLTLSVGVYLAKAITDGEPVRFFIRLERRF